MAIKNGLTEDSAKNFQLDAGILVTGLRTFDTAGLEAAALLGATSGGGTFTAIPEYRNIFDDIDGARGKYKDGDVIDNWEVKLTATLKEITKENIILALGAAQVRLGTTHDMIEGKMTVSESDYLSNVVWCGTLKGHIEPIFIELKNAINTKGFDMAFTDKGTGSVAVEFEARFDLRDPNVVPFAIHMPKVKPTAVKAGMQELNIKKVGEK
jgi:hypothetical protein